MTVYIMNMMMTSVNWAEDRFKFDRDLDLTTSDDKVRRTASHWKQFWATDVSIVTLFSLMSNLYILGTFQYIVFTSLISSNRNCSWGLHCTHCMAAQILYYIWKYFVSPLFLGSAPSIWIGEVSESKDMLYKYTEFY